MLSFGHCVLGVLILVPMARAFPTVLSSLSRRSYEGTGPITVPLTFDASGKYIVNVNMSSGPMTQRFGLALSTGTGYTMVAGSTCDSCGGVASYNASESSSARAMGSAQSLAILNSTVSGSIYKEDCGMQTINGGIWEYPNQTIVVANASDPIFSNGLSGVLGLGTNSREGNFSDTIFGAYMSMSASDGSFQYGMSLDAPDNSSSDGGVLHLLSPESSAYTGNVSWKGVQSASNSTNGTGLSSDWIVTLDGWTFTGGSGGITNNQGGACTVDPYYPNVYLPLNLATEIYGSIFGASQFSDESTDAQAWIVPCDTKMSYTAVFGTESFSVDQSILIINQGGHCVGAIEGWSDPSLTGYLFGARFLNEIYLIFNINNPNSSVPDSIGFAHKAQPSKKVLVGAIVGGTVGGVAFGVIVGIIGFVLYRRRAGGQRIWRSNRKSNIEPFTAVTTPASTFKDGALFAAQQQATQVPLLPNRDPSSANAFNAYFPGIYPPPVSPPMSVQRISTTSQSLPIPALLPMPISASSTQISPHTETRGLAAIQETHPSGNRPYSYPSAESSTIAGEAPPSYTPPQVQPSRFRKS